MESRIPPAQGASGLSDAAGAGHRGEKVHCATPTDLGTPFTVELGVSTWENARQATVCFTRLQRRRFLAFTAPVDKPLPRFPVPCH